MTIDHSRTIEMLCKANDNLTAEVNDLRFKLEKMTRQQVSEYSAGDKVLHAPSGASGVVAEIVAASGLVSIQIEGMRGIQTVHASDLVHDREDLNISYSAVSKMIEVCEILQAGIYGVTENPIDTSMLNQIFDELRGPQRNQAVINRLKRRIQTAKEEYASCHTH